jgi:hypothetical protein
LSPLSLSFPPASCYSRNREKNLIPEKKSRDPTPGSDCRLNQCSTDALRARQVFAITNTTECFLLLYKKQNLSILVI